MSHNLQPNDSSFIDSGSFALFVFQSVHIPDCLPPPPPFNPTAKFNWNHSLWVFCEDPFHSYRDTAQSGKETCIDQNGFKVIHNTIKKHKPVFHVGIVKTLIFFIGTAFYTVFSPQQEQDNPASSWLHDAFRILSVFPYVSLLSFTLLPYLQFCRLFFLFIFIVLWGLFGFLWVFFPRGWFFFPLFFLLPNSIVTQSECQSKFISIQMASLSDMISEWG